MSDKGTVSLEYQVQQSRKLKRLEAENSRLRNAQRWINCLERMPKKHQDCIVYSRGQVICAIYNLYNTDIERFYDMDGNPIAVTHWMPLPEAPKEER